MRAAAREWEAGRPPKQRLAGLKKAAGTASPTYCGPHPELASRSPFRDNLAAHEARVMALKRELAEAIDRRDYHAAVVLPSGIGLSGFDRALRQLLRRDIEKAAAQARPGWWPRLVAWLRWGSWERRARTAVQTAEAGEEEMFQELARRSPRSRIGGPELDLTGIFLPPGGTGIQPPRCSDPQVTKPCAECAEKACESSTRPPPTAMPSHGSPVMK